MRKITLDQVIAEHKTKSKKFADAYQKELMINAISKMVVKLRQQTQLTQAELAAKAGTTQPVIARLESGTNSRMPSLDLLSRIAHASKVRLSLNFEIR